jgi:glycosyltransferase involved in cell wall biosynthesis
MKPEASVIITFYNKIDILKLVLSGFERQSEKNFEILIADDGSDDSVVRELHRCISASPLQIKHVWHADKGWQKNIIMNRAIVMANTDYIIFTDGDCIPHRHFVKEHLQARNKNMVLTGRRVLLSRRISQYLSVSMVRNGFLEHVLFPWMLFERLLGKGQFIENAIYFKWTWIRKKINKKTKGLLGSNFSIHKNDILSINGFDERYLSPYIGEDTDLEYRLRLKGCKFKHLKHLAIQFHYFHPRLETIDSNYVIFDDNKRRNTAYTPFGIHKNP